MMAWIENGLVASIGAGLGAAAGLVAQSSGSTSDTILASALGGGGGLMGWIIYLARWTIPDKDRQIAELTAANAQWAETLRLRMEARDTQLAAVIDAKDKERESTVQRKDLALKEARTEFNLALQELTRSHAAELQRKDERCREELEVVRDLYQQILDLKSRPDKGNP